MALQLAADIVLTMHRTEARGLVAAMRQGNPVVATGWLGNLLATEANAAGLVPVRLVSQRDRRATPVRVVRAELDMTLAGAHVRRLADIIEACTALGEAVRRAAQTRLGPDTLAASPREIGPALP